MLGCGLWSGGVDVGLRVGFRVDHRSSSTSVHYVLYHHTIVSHHCQSCHSDMPPADAHVVDKLEQPQRKGEGLRRAGGGILMKSNPVHYFVLHQPLSTEHLAVQRLLHACYIW
jgi:hypothetical protein